MSPTLWTVNSVGFKLLAIYFFQKTMNSHLSPPSDLNPASSYIPKFIKELKRTNHAPNIQRFFQDFHHKTLTFVWSKVQSTPHIRGMFIAYNYNSSLPSFLASKNRFTRVVSAERREEKPISAGMGNDEKMEKHAQYERVFKHFDDNGDGKISASELQGHCGGMTLEEAQAAVESLDSDGDGLLELGDLVRLVEGVDEEERTKDLEEAFKVYENDGCGCITPKSLKRMLSRLGESRSIDECIVMISQFDLNGDGVLNFDEFKVMML